MSYQKERRFVLDMLETGKIDLDQATRLLDLLSLARGSATKQAPRPQAANKVYLEIDAEQDNLQQVLAKINLAFSHL